MNQIQQVLTVLAGLALFLPGLCALGYSLYEGPSSWMLDSRTFWGTPISLFVFWVGLAHAGTLLSAADKRRMVVVVQPPAAIEP